MSTAPAARTSLIAALQDELNDPRGARPVHLADALLNRLTLDGWTITVDEPLTNHLRTEESAV